MNIKIICVGDLKESYLKDMQAEYLKRLSKYCKLEIITLKDEKLPTTLNQSNCNIVKEKEANAILAKLNTPNSYTFVLDEKGKEYTSVELSEKIDKVMTMGNSTINFVIGGSLGLADSVRTKGNEVLSFSRLTFPHQMIRMFLLEQIFRCFKILNNETYHH
ncbi:MAG: 23S rRNA (pseudouridine(1915)-N(3))-methyltransferase RlmH [Clostridia bacterium]|nr:23S rRNA (pseudouridine(1915)-N(3))-methyltransferase RlmH [Clostridia bacterium]